jgi:glucosamine-6-phosphate deaminase
MRPTHRRNARLNALIAQHEIDVAFAGIGENGHLAFNDPPADFQVEDPFLVVNLDMNCRRQQMGEGWFATLNDVPQQAISMSIQQIMKARAVLCSVPDARKAAAMKACLQGEVSPDAPASILQRHHNSLIYLDPQSASLLDSNEKAARVLARRASPQKRKHRHEKETIRSGWNRRTYSYVHRPAGARLQ